LQDYEPRAHNSPSAGEDFAPEEREKEEKKVKS